MEVHNIKTKDTPIKKTNTTNFENPLYTKIKEPVMKMVNEMSARYYWDEMKTQRSVIDCDDLILKWKNGQETTVQVKNGLWAAFCESVAIQTFGSYEKLLSEYDKLVEAYDKQR